MESKRRTSRFLDDVKPDAVYLPIYASCYMCDVGQYITEYLGVPLSDI